MALIIRLFRCIKAVSRGYKGKCLYAEVIFISVAGGVGDDSQAALTL